MSNILLMFSLWRTLWCLFVSLLSFINISKKTYNNTLYLLLSVIGFMLIDIILIVRNKRIYNLQIIYHHIIVIILLLFGIYTITFSNNQHYDVINMCISTEVVTTIHIVNHLAKKYKSIFYFRLYRLLYILLTVFWRGNIWNTIIRNAINNSNSNMLCVYGITPFVVFDIVWVRQCINGLYKIKY